MSPSSANSSSFKGVTVRIVLRPGTTEQLQSIGIAANEPAAAQFPGMSTHTGAWAQTNARFKVEGKEVIGAPGQMTTQVGRGAALDIVNNNIVNFKPIKK